MSDFADLLSPSGTTSSSTDLGESGGTFTAVGQRMAGVVLSDGEFEGGAKRAHLFLFEATMVANCRLCLCFVGSGGRRFCLKSVSVRDASGSWTCGIQKHSNKFTPEPDTFYPRGNETCAYCTPAFPLTLVPISRVDEVKTSKYTISEWSLLFKEFSDNNVTAATAFNTVASIKFAFDPSIPLKTPAKGKLAPYDSDRFLFYTPSGIQRIINQEATNDHGWWSDDAASPLPQDLLSFCKSVRSFLLDFESWWKQPLSDTQETLNTTQEDLHVLKKSCESLNLAVGKPIQLQGMDFPDIWTAIKYLGTLQANAADSSTITEHLSNLERISEQVPNIWDEISVLQGELLSVQDTLDKFKARFRIISPLLQSIKTIQGTLNTLVEKTANSFRPRSSPTFNTQPRSFTTSTAPLDPEWNSHLRPYHPDTQTDFDVGARLSTIEEKLSTLENRIVGDGVTIGSFTFQTLDDVRLWCGLHLKTHRFGLFLDGVSIFEFLAQEHADTSEVLTNLYNSQKNQFNNVYDSKVMSSCQNFFPTVFGHSSSDGLDTSRTLLGLATPDKWDNNGVTGLRFQITRELINVDTQITTAINVAFRDYPEAAALSKELLYRSKKIVNELSNFMSQDFSFWHAKGYDKHGSWELTCCSV
jgi:hypothetical protein